MISDRLRAIVRCPDCGNAVQPLDADRLLCGGCGRTVAATGGYLDLRPAAAYAEQTKYLDESLHADARHERVSPPLLGAGVRNRMLRRFLQLEADDVVADLGCGSGRMLVWNRDRGAHLVGVDVSAHFAREAIDGADLVLGDLRRLPFASGVFTKAWSLDVFEHLSRGALEHVLAEMARVLAPGGRLFVYSHVRQNSRLALGLRSINRVAAALERRGWIDLRQEHLRKSDHLNPLADIPDLEDTVARAGFRVARIRYYTPLIGGFVENIAVRVAERALGRRAERSAREDTSAAGGVPAGAARLARTAAKQRIAEGGMIAGSLKLVTALMQLDVVLFGRVRSGPFFALLERTRAVAPAGAQEAARR